METPPLRKTLLHKCSFLCKCCPPEESEANCFSRVTEGQATTFVLQQPGALGPLARDTLVHWFLCLGGLVTQQSKTVASPDSRPANVSKRCAAPSHCGGHSKMHTGAQVCSPQDAISTVCGCFDDQRPSTEW